MQSRHNLPAVTVHSLLANESLRSLVSLALVVLLGWIFRQPLLDLAWNFSASLGLQEPASGLELDAPDPRAGGHRSASQRDGPLREIANGLPLPGLTLRENTAELKQRVSQLSDSLDLKAELHDNAWPARNMLRLPAPYGCRHWYVISGENQGFHLYRFTLGCHHEIDLLPDMQYGRELIDARPLVEYYRSQRCSRCRFRESDQAGVEGLADE